MPTFFKRKYPRGLPGRTERLIGGAILVLVGLLVGAFLLTGGLLAGVIDRVPALARARTFIGISDAPLFALSMQPASGQAGFPGVEGLTSPARIERYTDNLYEKIDGREGQYRAYNFVELRFGQYTDAQQQPFDVYLYDMAGPESAMGIYMSERGGEAEALPIGREGYASGASVYFWKSRYYVNVLGPIDGGAEAQALAKKIAEAVAGTITDAGGGFWADRILPQAARVPNSLKFRATSALGYDFLENLYLADYQAGGKKYSLFIVKAGSPAAAKELFGKFAEATAKYDKVLSRETAGGGEMLLSQSLEVFGAAFNKSIYLGGVVECEDRELAAKAAEDLRQRIPE